MPKRIAVIGSREYPNLRLVREFVRRLADRDPGATVVSGNARGVDRVAEAEARAVGLVVDSIKADWLTYPKAAGFIRNGEIVRRCNAVAAFWDGVSGGTMDTVKKAIAANKPVAVWGPDGTLIRRHP